MEKINESSLRLGVTILAQIFLFIVTFTTRLYGFRAISDFCAQIIMITLSETIFRLFPYVFSNYEFIIATRTENIDRFLEENKQKEDVCLENFADKCRTLMRSSFTMLGTLSGLTLTLIIFILNNKTELDWIEEILFLLPSFFAFLVFVVTLALCYTVVSPNMPNRTVIKATSRYYDLTVIGLIAMAVTFTWGIHTFSQLSIFTLDDCWGQISLVLGTIFLGILYGFAYVDKKKSKLDS